MAISTTIPTISSKTLISFISNRITESASRTKSSGMMEIGPVLTHKRREEQLVVAAAALLADTRGKTLSPTFKRGGWVAIETLD